MSTFTHASVGATLPMPASGGAFGRLSQLRTVLLAGLYVGTVLVPGFARLLDRITGGRLSAPALARQVWHSLKQNVHSGLCDPRTVSGQPAQDLSPLAVRALTSSDSCEQSRAIHAIVGCVLSGTLKKCRLDGIMPDALTSVLHGWLEDVVGREVARHFGVDAAEKLLGTMAAEFGPLALGRLLMHATGAASLPAVVRLPLLAVLKSAVLNRPEYDCRDDPALLLLARLCYHGLQGSPRAAYIDAVCQYAPLTARIVTLVSQGAAWAGSTLAGAASVAFAPLGDVLRHDSGPAYAARLCAPRRLASTDDLAALPTAVPRPQATACMRRQADVAERVLAGLAGCPSPGAAAKLAAWQSDIAPAGEVLEALAPAQIAPLGDRGEIEVTRDNAGRLRCVETHSHCLLTIGDALSRQIVRELERSASTLECDAQDDGVLPEALACRVRRLRPRYAGVAAGGEDPVAALVRICDGDVALARRAGEVLDDEAVRLALVGPALAALARRDEGCTAGGVSLTLVEPMRPELHFGIRRAGVKIVIEIEARWRISAFHARRDVARQPRDDSGRSHIALGVAVELAPNAPASACLTGAYATIVNRLRFDPAHGALLDTPDVARGGRTQAEVG
jgi:hypothetical protein